MFEKLSLFVGASIVCAAGAANAGNLITPTVEAPVAVASTITPTTYSWEGAYIGGNLNYGKGKLKAAGDFEDALSEAGASKTLAKPDGTSVALRGGYDWEFERVVAGVGAEYNLGKYKGGFTGQYRDYPELDGFEFKVKNVGTLFGRLGYAITDQWIGYGLLGYSWGRGEAIYADEREKITLKGVTYGIGAAYAIDQNWSAYAEYTFIDFGKIKDTDGDLRTNLQQIKLGVNYRF